MGLSQIAARGSAITLASQVAKLSLMMASTIVLARIIAPSEYGIVAMCLAILGVGEILRDFGFSMAALQATSLTDQQHSNLHWLNVAVGASLTVLAMFAATSVAAFYEVEQLSSVFMALAAGLVLGSIGTQFRVRLNRHLKFGLLALIDVVSLAIGMVAGISFALFNPSAWALVVLNLVTTATGTLLAIAFARWLPLLPRRTDMGGLLAFGGRFSATQLLSYATRNVDSIAIGRFWGPTSLGFYDRAYQLGVVPLSQINTPMSRISIPVLSKVRSDKPRYLAGLRKAQLLTLYGTATVFALLAALGTEVVALLLGSDWAKTGPLLSILAVGCIFRAAQQVPYWVFMSNGLAKEQLRFYCVTQPLIAAIILCGLPWGAQGVAIAFCVAYALFWAASVYYSCRCAGLESGTLYRDALRVIGLVGLPSAVAAKTAVILLPTDYELASLIAGGLAAMAWYCVAYLCSAFVRRDVAALRTIIKLAIVRN